WGARFKYKGPLDHSRCTVTSPKVSLKPEKKPKPAHKPQNTGDSRAQKELMTPGIVDFGLIQESFKAPHPLQTPGTYRFGRLSHHSFFSRHHPHPQHVTHIQGKEEKSEPPGPMDFTPSADSTGKPVCVVRDESSLVPLPPPTFLSYCLMGMPTISDPIGDPQSNRNPQLSSDTWKKELKELTSRVAFFTKEDEPVMKEVGAGQRRKPPRPA
uniref:Thymus, brain and testes associated n=1 Tax=Jaculus jaculus TaxID=51337 RepID=A0A8C5LJD6_JACJA